MSGQIIIFEKILPVHKWVIRWYVFRRQEVCFLSLNRDVGQGKWLRDYCAEGKLKKIELNFKSLAIWEGAYFDAAFDHSDEVFNGLRTKKIVQAVKELYQTGSIELAYRIMIHLPLARFCYLAHVLDKMHQKFPERELVLIPATELHFYKTSGCEINEFNAFVQMTQKDGQSLFNAQRARFPWWATWLSHIFYGWHMVKGLGMTAVFPFWAFFTVILNRLRRTSSPGGKQYMHAFRVLPIGENVDNRTPQFEFLVDGDDVNKGESLFISNQKLYGAVKDYLESKNMFYIDDFNRFFDIRDLGRIIPTWFTLLTSFLKNGYAVSLGSLKVIYYYLKWHGFCRQIAVKNLISSADSGIESVARNLILEGAGTKSYFHMDSSNFGCFYTSDKNLNTYRGLIGYVYYDSFISWNDKVSDYFKASRCCIKKYINTGCLWSERIRLIQEGEIPSSFKEELHCHKFQDGMKLVAVFDSTIHDDCITDYEEGIRFLEGVVRLLEDRTDIFVVLKEKKPRASHRRRTGRYTDLIAVYHRLDSHPRAFCVASAFSASEVAAMSDLVLSFPFTSPTLEAIAARKKAIWYDSCGKYRWTYFDRIPGLVCHNYEELSKRVNQLLFLTSEEEYDRYLDVEVKGKVESYLDGKAITRFRRCLLDKGSMNDAEDGERSLKPESIFI